MARKKKEEKVIIDPWDHPHDFEYTPEPNRFFEVGEKVFVFHSDMTDAEIVESKGDNIWYKVRVRGYSDSRFMREKDKGPFEFVRVYHWHEIGKLRNKPESAFKSELNFPTQTLARSLGDLIRGSFWSGYDDSIEFQRGYVWEDSDRIALLDSLFMGVSIGSIAMNYLDWHNRNEAKMGHEVIDGKQRLQALRSYFLDEWEYYGYFYHDLSRSDRHFLEEQSLPVIEAKNLNQRQKIEWFIRLNTNGKIMDKNHLAEVKKMLEGMDI